MSCETCKQAKRRSFWFGVIVGAHLMAMLDLTDIHVEICAGECDYSGGDLIQGPEGGRR